MPPKAWGIDPHPAAAKGNKGEWGIYFKGNQGVVGCASFTR
jgi:hypothetical protein